MAAPWCDTARVGVPEQLAQYLGRRIEQGHLRPVPPVPTAARLFMEIITIFAVHMRWAPCPVPLREADLKEAVVDNLVHAYVRS